MSNDGGQNNEDEDERHQSIRKRVPRRPQWAIDCGVLKSFVNLWYSLAVVEVQRTGVLAATVHDVDHDNSLAAGLNSTSSSKTTEPLKHHHVGIYLNPTDIRCYRMIARPLCIHTNDLLFNQHADAETVISTSIAVAAIADTIQQQLDGRLFVQSLHLGNNSMIANDEGELKLGSDKEPYFYHVHLLCRGNPNRSYFEGAPTLGGPPIGMAFQAQDDTKNRRTPEEGKADTVALVDGLRNLLLTNKHTETTPTSLNRQYARILSTRDERFNCLDWHDSNL